MIALCLPLEQGLGLVGFVWGFFFAFWKLSWHFFWIMFIVP